MPENSLAVLYCVRVEAATFNSGSLRVIRIHPQQPNKYLLKSNIA